MRRTGRFRSAVRWFVADLHAALAIALAIPILVVEAAHGFAEAGPVLGSTLAYLALQLGLAIVVGHRRRGWIATLRFVIAIGFVGLLSFVEPRTETTLPVLYIPIITLAAATERTATATSSPSPPRRRRERSSSSRPAPRRRSPRACCRSRSSCS